MNLICLKPLKLVGGLEKKLDKYYKQIKEAFVKETLYEGTDMITKNGFVSFEQFIKDFLEFLEKHNADISAIQF